MFPTTHDTALVLADKHVEGTATDDDYWELCWYVLDYLKEWDRIRAMTCSPPCVDVIIHLTQVFTKLVLADPFGVWRAIMARATTKDPTRGRWQLVDPSMCESMRGYGIQSLAGMYTGYPSVFDVWDWIFSHSPVRIRDVQIVSGIVNNTGPHRRFPSFPWAVLGKAEEWFYLEYNEAVPDIGVVFIAGEFANEVLDLLSDQQLHDIGFRRTGING